MCATRDLMSRCAKCNGEGYVQLTVDQARAAGGIQEKVLRVVSEYWQCLRCKKVYWEGPKVCAAASHGSLTMYLFWLFSSPPHLDTWSSKGPVLMSRCCRAHCNCSCEAFSFLYVVLIQQASQKSPPKRG